LTVLPFNSHKQKKEQEYLAMSRIQQRVAEAKVAGKKLLVAYIVNGDPQPEVTLPTLHEMVAKGVDVIELGVPFSDPMAEGPVIQKGLSLIHISEPTRPY